MRNEGVIYSPKPMRTKVTSDKIQITQRDTQTFYKLFEAEVLTRLDIQDLYYRGGSLSNCSSRLQRLTAAGIIKRLPQKQFYYEGRKAFLYAPCKETARQVANFEGIDITEVPWNGRTLEPDNLFLPHLQAISAVNVAFSMACIRHGFTMQKWYNTLLMERMKMIDEVATGEAMMDSFLRPDAYSVIHDTNIPNSFFIEVDRDTEKKKIISDKVYKYRYYMTPIDGVSAYEKRYKTSGGRIIFIASTYKRMITLKEITESCGGRGRFWFSVLPDLQNHDALVDKIWRKAGAPNEETFSLIW
jgi:Replication-relaxation